MHSEVHLTLHCENDKHTASSCKYRSTNNFQLLPCKYINTVAQLYTFFKELKPFPFIFGSQCSAVLEDCTKELHESQPTLQTFLEVFLYGDLFTVFSINIRKEFLVVETF